MRFNKKILFVRVIYRTAIDIIHKTLRSK